MRCIKRYNTSCKWGAPLATPYYYVSNDLLYHLNGSTDWLDTCGHHIGLSCQQKYRRRVPGLAMKGASRQVTQSLVRCPQYDATRWRNHRTECTPGNLATSQAGNMGSTMFHLRQTQRGNESLSISPRAKTFFFFFFIWGFSQMEVS